MSTRTTNYKLVKPAENEFADIDVINSNMDIIDSSLKGLEKELSDNIDTINKKLIADAVVPSISLGMNSVIRKTDNQTSIPKFTIQGKSYVNLLGKDGNCEDVSKFGVSATTIELDSTNKVFGTNSIKITTNTANSAHDFRYTGRGSVYIPIADIGLSIGECFTASGYTMPNVGGALLRVSYYDTTQTFISTVDSGINLNTSGFTRLLCKGTIPANTVYIALYVRLTNASGNVTFTGTTENTNVDGIMLQKITSDEYTNLTVDQLLEKYPYIDSYVCLQNPYIEVRHDNLVRNGNCEEGVGWWQVPGNTGFTIVNGKLRVTANAVGNYIAQAISVKPNTDYYINYNATDGTATGTTYISNPTDLATIKTGAGTFNSGNNTLLLLRLRPSAVGYCDYDHIHLIEGTTPPTAYKPCGIERCVIEGKFTSDDTLTYENGEVSGLLNWKHRTLYGKDYDWVYSTDYVGYKQITLLNILLPNIKTDFTNICIKYDGKSLPYADTAGGADRHNCASNGTTYLSILDTDTGWAETIAPNADEVKAFMNGWKAVSNNGTRYRLWSDINNFSSGTDIKSYPSETATTLTVATSGTISVTVANSSMFSVGDSICVMGNPVATISAISGNVLTLSATQAVQPIGRVVVRADTPTTDTRILTYCKNNIAPNYEGYQLHYKLANPEPITDVNTHIHGDTPKFDNGDDYLYLDYGMVLGEVASPQLDPNTRYYINTTNGNLYPSILQNKAEIISAVYRNGIHDTNWELRTNSLYAYGIANASSYMPVIYDTNATYTVDYQILKTTQTTPTSITASYQQDILNAISDLAEIVNNKQKHDSALDNLVDLSVYERINRISSGQAVSWYHMYNAMYIEYLIPIRYKKCIPIMTLTDYKIQVGTGSSAEVVTSKFNLNYVGFYETAMLFQFRTTDTATITNVKTYGAYVALNAIVDCRGRV
ncbi:hypothetical protein [Clostridium aminobutyricum]|uniref:Uncharacterized protein n=1 Tax=Clostridium aminobutyricum TaxID=33953 RepID=A0A939D9C3_CLOAM|nr:hypothetical protein [Clostridium aminobutyricum]MBN7773153.1 hypothetical protein [Clostridium aminobutyricum]